MKKCLIIVIFLLTGCWNYKELNDIAIVTSMSIDKIDESYVVSVGVINTNKTSDEKVTIYSGKGKTLSEAIKNIDLYTPKQLYFGHLSVVTINEKLAKSGLNQITDYILRSNQIPKNFFLSISKDTDAKEIIKSISPLESFPSQNISSKFLDINNNETEITSITFNKYIDTLKKIGIEPILPTITLIKEQNATRIDTIALFKNDKLITFANENESKGINILLNKIDEVLIPIKCNNNNIVIQASNIKSSIKVNNKIIIDVKANGIIKELNCDNKKIVSNIKKYTEKEIKKLINDSIALSKKNKTDIFGFQNKSKPKYDIDFTKLDTKINVNINVEEVNFEKN